MPYQATIAWTKNSQASALIVGAVTVNTNVQQAWDNALPFMAIEAK
jgi:hypothetical protein